MTRPTVERATEADAAELAALHGAVAEALTRAHGRGHWSHASTERGVRFAMTISRVFVARARGRIVATFALQTRKPWAIDVAHFSPALRPIYLVGFAVAPSAQGRGLGSRLMDAAIREARGWPGDALRLDAYDAAAGAAGFYAARGFQERGRVVYRGTPLVYFEMRFEGAVPVAATTPRRAPRAQAGEGRKARSKADPAAPAARRSNGRRSTRASSASKARRS